MDRSIKIKIWDNEITSRPFDMECYRLMYDAMTAGEHELASFIGIHNLFPDVELSQIPADELAKAADALTVLFLSVKASGTPQKTMAVEPEGHPVRKLYKSLLQAHGILPSDVDRQDPIFLYQMITEEHTDGVAAADVPAVFRPFLGMK